jgi:Putative glycosyl/glycerophosphate transferases involved in teichoic acid biosynthesis TagF/TagB/EpsJ/RodC
MKGALRCFFIILCIQFALPSKAHAYLDPGTGNLLVYLIISIFGVFAYFLKDLYFKTASRLGFSTVTLEKHANNEDIILFSEGKLYWSTFKPIVERLIEREYPFKYCSMDIEDPGLTLENRWMNSRYIGTGSAAFARMAHMRGLIMLETTPNIGTPGYPMPVPRHIPHLVHVLHGIGDIGFYARHAFDSCTALVTMNKEMERTVRHIEALRNLPAKACIPLGVPCFDELVGQITPQEGRTHPPVILIAPSWGEKNCLLLFGTTCIRWLAEAGYRVIVRPHPLSFSKEKGLIAELDGLTREFATVSIDAELDRKPSFMQADLMISDKSGVRFDFAFLRERPVITLDVPAPQRELFEVSDLDYVWEEDIEQKIGAVIAAETFASMEPALFLSLVESALQMPRANFNALKTQSIVNIGTSGRAIADWAISTCQSRQRTAHEDCDA